MSHFLHRGLLEAAQKNSVNFHMPGHKNRGINMPWLADVARIDTTETVGTDNLAHPEGILRQSLDRIAAACGAVHSLYSVNGSTGSVYMAQSAALRPGETLLVQRDSHKSVYNGAILNRLELDFLYPRYNRQKQVVCGIDPEQVQEKLENNPDIRAVMIVYPNYYGVTADLRRIADIVHAHDALLIVDEAHGAHLHFSDRLPPSALDCGADIVLQSTHKTLPSLTQTSLIHLGSDRVSPERLKRASALFQTTSPSYTLMTSTEHAIEWMDSEEGRAALDRLIDQAESVRERVRAMPGMRLLEKTDGVFDLDPTRILLGHDRLSGNRLKDILYRDHNINMEMADLYYTLALCTVNNTEADFAALLRALAVLAEGASVEPVDRNVSPEIVPATVRVSMYDAYYLEKEVIRLEDALGRISGQQLTPYPPGVPLVLPGEEITAPILTQLLSLQKEGIDIIGLFGPERSRLEVLKA